MAPRPHANKCRKRMQEEMKKSPGGRRRLEEAERKVHEDLGSRLVAEHGEKDEMERPGITGSKVERESEPAEERSPGAADPPSVHQDVGGDRAVGARADERQTSTSRSSGNEAQGPRAAGAEEPPARTERGNKGSKRDTAETN